MNTIYKDDDTLGFYEDLRRELMSYAVQNIKDGDFEGAKMTCDNLLELEELKDYTGIIILSENNGMGFTARKWSDVAKQYGAEI